MISIAPIVPRKWCRVRSEVSCMALGSRACSADHHLDARPITQSQTSNAADRCVTMMAVRPRFRMRPSISRSVLGSWADVHSSSRSTGGLEWTARATARCCSRSPYQLSLVSSQVRSIWRHLPSIFTAFQVWPLPVMRPLAMPAASRSLE